MTDIYQKISDLLSYNHSDIGKSNKSIFKPSSRDNLKHLLKFQPVIRANASKSAKKAANDLKPQLAVDKSRISNSDSIAINSIFCDLKTRPFLGVKKTLIAKKSEKEDKVYDADPILKINRDFPIVQKKKYDNLKLQTNKGLEHHPNKEHYKVMNRIRNGHENSKYHSDSDGIPVKRFRRDAEEKPEKKMCPFCDWIFPKDYSECEMNKHANACAEGNGCEDIKAYNDSVRTIKKLKRMDERETQINREPLIDMGRYTEEDVKQTSIEFPKCTTQDESASEDEDKVMNCPFCSLFIGRRSQEFIDRHIKECGEDRYPNCPTDKKLYDDLGTIPKMPKAEMTSLRMFRKQLRKQV